MPISLHPPAISYDAQGVAGISAESPAEAFFGIGQLHARHRQAQARQVWSAALGQLSTSGLGALPGSPTYVLDEMAHRIEAPRLGREAWLVMRAPERDYLQAYVDGFVHEGTLQGGPWESAAIGLLPLDQVTPAAVLSGALFMAYHSQARGQSRMEQLLLQLLQAGANPQALRDLHHPHLAAWHPESGADGAAYGAILGAHVGGAEQTPPAGGSNAWAVAPKGSAGPQLFGDPHMAVGELPASFFEVRVRLPDGRYWLGGTLPGLPAVVVGRNAQLAWSNTHGCGKTLDSSLLQVDAHGRVASVQGERALVERAVVLGPAWAPWARKHISLWDSPYGTLLSHTPTGQVPKPGTYLAQRWAAGQTGQQLADSVAGYMGMVTCESVGAAQQQMQRHQIFSFHMVYADRAGSIAYQQVGGVPERPGSNARLLDPWLPHDPHTPVPPWGSGFAPLPATGAAHTAQPEEGFIASANEAQNAVDGQVVAPFAQPTYRHDRIVSLLRRGVGPSDAALMQLDSHSLQGERLTPNLLAALEPHSPVAQALTDWDFESDATSVGAHAFHLAYWAALHGLAEKLGGTAWHRALDTTEVSVWWAQALDARLADKATWQGDNGRCLRAAVRAVGNTPVRPWGEVQTVQPSHPMAGLVPLDTLRRRWGLITDVMPLPGSIATVRQGNLVPDGSGRKAVAAAYRMACDLSTDELRTMVPTSPLDADHGRLLQAWHQGTYHVLRPPQGSEAYEPPL